MVDRRSLLHAGGILVLVLVVAPFVVFAVPQVVGANHSYVVLSSSMSPAIQPGDVVIVNDVDPARIERKDVITFEPPDGHRESTAGRVTHRVVGVVEREDGLYFRTKGDANEDPDQALVPAENVIGKRAFTIPLIGHVIVFAGTDHGLIALVVVPSVLIVLNEVYELVSAARASDERNPPETDADVDSGTSSNRNG